MKQRKYFFIVSTIAILFTTVANAATVTGLATPNYVDGAVGALNAQLKAVAKSGSYNDLTNKPTIPAAQVNSDWNATSGMAQILNRPTLGSLAEKSAVGAAEITDGSVGTAELGADAVTNAKLADNAVQSENIKNGEVKTDDLASNSVTTAKIANGNVTADKIGSGAVTNAKIADGAVTAKKIVVADNIVASGSVKITQASDTGVITISGTDTKYTLPAANGATLGGVKTGGDMTASSGVLTITDGKVTSAKILDGTIAAADLAANSVTSAKIADGTIVNADISDSAAISQGKISGLTTALAGKQLVANMQKGSPATALTDTQKAEKYPSIAYTETLIGGMLAGQQFGDLAYKNTVNASDIDANAVTTAKILDGNVTNAKLAADAVTTAKIANKNVTKAKLEDSVQTSLGKADTALQSVSGGAAVSGKVATAVVKSGTAVAVTMDYVKIPVGSATAPTSVAQIWVQ